MTTFYFNNTFQLVYKLMRNIKIKRSFSCTFGKSSIKPPTSHGRAGGGLLEMGAQQSFYGKYKVYLWRFITITVKCFHSYLPGIIVLTHNLQ